MFSQKRGEASFFSPGISLRWFAAMPAKEKERETEGEKTKLFLLRATVGVRYLVQLVQGTDRQGVFHICVRDLI